MSQTRRMIDANANRAREALRTLEDIARFVLSSAALCDRIKALRHELRAALDAAGLDAATLAAWRDTAEDVGTGIEAPSEMRRDSIRSIAVAAGHRLSESLRVIEECLKTEPSGPDAARRVERVRYAGYDAERDVLLRLGSDRARQWKLCVIITESLCDGRPWEWVVEQAIEGGADALQLREKHLEGRALVDRARRLTALARAAPGRVDVIVNDRPDAALAAGADGVHLGIDDLTIRDARRIVGPGMLIGASTTNMDQARAAAEAGADYCGVGPMFASETKQRDHISGSAYLREYTSDAEASRLPHLAIGGITPENVPELISAGCRGVAVCSAVLKAKRPAEACRALCRAVGSR